MVILRPFIAAIAVAAGWYGYTVLSEPWNHVAMSGGVVIALAVILTASATTTRRSPVVAKLGGMTWTMEDFCRGWLITGDTGSGKTRSGITPLLYQVFKHSPGWGGICIDDKGLYWETLSEMAKHFGRESDLILLQVQPDNPVGGWTPTHTYNLTSDRGIPWGTYAKFVVDTASSLGQQGDKGFFKNQAQTHIAAALELLYETGADVTLENAYNFLLNQTDMEEILDDLAGAEPTERRRLLDEHFRNRFLSQPPEQIGGVKETIANYLQYFLTPEISQVFCPAENSFDFSDIDRGKIICVAMPQKFQAERRYVCTFLKMLFYTHVLRRFDKPKDERKDDNLLILWADEAQRFVTASEDGMSDYNCVDVIREARATLVAAAQSSSSFIPPLGREKARVLSLNLRNRMIFRAADEEGANDSADYLGKKKVIKKSWGYSGGKMSWNFPSRRSTKSSRTFCVGCQNIPPCWSIATEASNARYFRRWSRTARSRSGSADGSSSNTRTLCDTAGLQHPLDFAPV